MPDPDDISDHPPAVDIDEYIEDCNFRIERMAGDSLWACAYTSDNDPDHHFDITSTDDGRIHVVHRIEPNIDQD